MQDELPPLQLWQKAERRHAGVCIPAADFPEQRAIALCLHVRLRQIRRFRRAMAVLTVTRRAPLLEQLATTRRGFLPMLKRVGPEPCRRRRAPARIALANLHDRRLRPATGHDRHDGPCHDDGDTRDRAGAHRRLRSDSS
jgi:hypothetical protein